MQSHSAAQQSGAMQLSIDGSSAPGAAAPNIGPAEATALVRSVQSASQGGGLALPMQHSPTTTVDHAMAEGARPAPAVPVTAPAPAPVPPRPAEGLPVRPPLQAPTWAECAQGPVIAFAAYLLFQAPQLHKLIQSAMPSAKRPDGRLTTAGHVLNASLFGLLYLALGQVADRCT